MRKCEAPSSGRGRRGIPGRGIVAAVALALTAACDIPTELPRFEPRFVVPVEGTALDVADLLPASVTVAGGAFRVSIPGSSTVRTLGDMCEACRAAHLTVVPKPAFTHTFSVVAPLPQPVAAATVTSGDALIRVRHAFGFDPLHPPGRTQDGTLTIMLRSGERELGAVVIGGPFPSGAELQRTISIAPGEISAPLELLATIASPAGGPVAVNRDATFRVDLLPAAVTAAEARVGVTNRQVSVAPVQVDLTGMDEELRGRARSGGMIMLIDNPFEVGGVLQLRMRAPQNGTDIQRSVNVSPGGTTQRIELSQQELRSLLGQWVDVSLTGALSGVAGPVTVRPGTQIRLDPRLELVLEIGS